MQHFTASSRLNLTGGRLFLVVLMSVLGGLFIVRTQICQLLYLNVHSVNSVIALGRDATFFSKLNVESSKQITL